MHIGVLTHNYPRFAGDFSGVFVEALCREFAAQGERVTVWAPYDAAYRRAGDDAVSLQLYRYIWPQRLHRLGYMRSMQSDLRLRLESVLLSPPFFASAIAHVMRQARRQRPDVLHAHWLLPNGFVAALVSRRLGIPLVISVPGSDAQVAASNSLFGAMARFAMQQANLLTANSTALRDAVIALGGDPRKFDLIIYGVNPAALQPDDSHSQTLRRQLNVAPDAFVLLCVGRMVYKKGFDVLLRALADPALNGVEAVAIMVGDGDQRTAWQALAAELGVADRVRWTGSAPINRMGAFYNMADVLVMPSVSRPADGLNVAVLDAMSCAKPVVGSRAAGNELAICHGETGLLVNEQEPNALAAALRTLANDPVLRRQMGQAGRRRIDQELGWPHLALRYRQHFAHLVA